MQTYGGTNWGNLGQPGSYSSYDYGAVIRENRMIDREKYAEAKLMAHFIVSSPAYLDAVPGNETNTTFVSTGEITVTPVVGKRTAFYITRQTDFRSLDTTDYRITLPTSEGNVTVPQLSGALSIVGRDSKVHVADYDLDGVNLLYCSADIMTHSKTGGKRTVIMYGGPGEKHEFALPSSSCRGRPYVEGGEVNIERRGSTTVVQWEVTPERKVLHYDGLDVYMLWRNEAYDYWSLELEAPAPIGNYSAMSKETVIVKAGYLMRSASIDDHSLHLMGDVNATTEVEIISGFNHRHGHVYFNGEKLHHVRAEHGRRCATVGYHAPELSLPDVSSLDWKYIDSLPEIQASYDDSRWTVADNPTTNPKNYSDDGVLFELLTPTSLISADYGYHTGSLVYHGYFQATGEERILNLTTQGGGGHGHGVWLNDEFLGSFAGDGSAAYDAVYDIPFALTEGEEYIITVLMSHEGTEGNWTPGLDLTKTPRGIMEYGLNSHDPSDILWRMTGNLGGEQYRDQTRGPLNEGGMFAERQGYHLPSPPSEDWESRSPLEGQSEAGVGFYTAEFALDLPEGYDIPLSFVYNNSAVDFSSEVSDLQMTNSTSGPSQYRTQLFINGWQFGIYTNHIGPQTRFVVPEGILNYHGMNTIALTLWAHDAEGAKLDGLELKADAIIATGAVRPELVESPAWEERDGAY